MNKETTLCSAAQFMADAGRYKQVVIETASPIAHVSPNVSASPNPSQGGERPSPSGSGVASPSPFGEGRGGAVESRGGTVGGRASIPFHVTSQPLFNKNFDLLRQSLEDYVLRGYRLYILADSTKQHQRLRDIFGEMVADPERSAANAQRSL